MKMFIYGLRDPRTREIRYVGQSTIGFSRPRAHYRSAISGREQSPKGNWIRELNDVGLMYEIVVLEKIKHINDLNAAESLWMYRGRLALGDRFLNISDGNTQHKLRRKQMKKFMFSLSADADAWLISEADRLGLPLSELMRRVIDKERTRARR